MNVRILTHARIYTGAPAHPWAHTLAVVDGKIAALDAAALGWQDAPDAITEDLGGALVIPGLMDAHVHLMWYSRGLRELDLRDLDREATVGLVAQRARELPPGTWITGRGWDQNIWEDASFPTAAELDRVAPDHPVALNAKNGHAMVVNSAALRAAGVTAQTPDPVHGKIARDERGAPNGLFFEDAIAIINRTKPGVDVETLADLFDEAQRHLLRRGITGVHDVDTNPAFAAAQELRRQGRQRIRIVKYVRVDVLDDIIAAGVRSGIGDDWLRFGGLKLFADGALGSRTAAMFEPYQEEPDNTGIMTQDPEQLREIAQRAAENGIALAIHAIGDRANHLVLDVLESVKPLNRHLRHRIEHVQIITPEDRQRLADQGFVASIQPTHAIHDIRMADRYWGDRCRDAYAWRALLDAGAKVAFGSDTPMEIFDPFLGLYAAVARRSEADGYPGPEGWYPEQRLTLGEALHGFTAGTAYAAGLENRLGQLTPGYLADLVVLDRDIFSLPPAALLETQVQRVMVGGTWQDLD